jgi:class 3 adenylate cyclase/tetratricopeptide (TPR) repeat protein
VVCENCGTENPAGSKFCLSCGTTFGRTCPACGAALPAEARFCNVCGAALDSPAPTGSRQAPAVPASVMERRLVSVLFADLVGFTSLSETRDSEEVRDLLTKYFEVAGRIVERYGGSVEKFIGDAVMAVWGTPIAKEDDAERAVRAALELLAAIPALGQDSGEPGLRARAGVLTGEAAVTLGATGQGMVAGDLVNTAARIQSSAEPGTVLVGESTARATEAAIAYEDAGSHEVKGKVEPLHLWRALRVVALVGGALKSVGLEAPFVGREREFRVLKELFHTSADEGRAQLVSVWGIAGIGKSRLSWEFFKYIDGLAQGIWWHRGRCLPYGEGVTYWALAEMIRSRAGIAEGEDHDSATVKLRDTVAQHVSDDEERRWVEPRLAHLLGLEDRSTRDPEELFSAWRLFFERLAATSPVLLIFEDLQWADRSLLDFIQYLMEWSRNHPIFVITLARPELQDRHPGWGAGKRNLTSLALDPLPAEAMEALLEGLTPGLTEDVRAAILERAEGVPLYAVETVRMLIDRGLLIREGASYRPTGPIAALDVPESLHALIAARLDALESDERRLIQCAAVLGKTFMLDALVELSGVESEEARTVLANLVRKEILGLQSDPRSPERGQYGFLQDLVKRVAYETLSKKDRRNLHVAAAQHLVQDWGDDQDTVEIRAFHYLEAYRLAPDDPESAEVKDLALRALILSGERASNLAAHEEAVGYFDTAFELADDPAERGAMAEKAGIAAEAGNSNEHARERLESAVQLFRSAGLSHDAARCSARLGEVLWFLSDIDGAVALMDASLAELADAEPDEDIATLIAQAARLHFFRGDYDVALKLADQALELADPRQYWAVLSEALNTKSLVLDMRGRSEESIALLQHALDLAVEHAIQSSLSRARFNLAFFLWARDRLDEALEQDLSDLAHARLLGNRLAEALVDLHLVGDYWALGRWDDVIRMLAETPLPPEVTKEHNLLVSKHLIGIYTLVPRGDLEQAHRIMEAAAPIDDPSDVQAHRFRTMALSAIHLAEGNPQEALALLEETIRSEESGNLREAIPLIVPAVEAALQVGLLGRAEELLVMAESLPPSVSSPSVRAQVTRFRARLAALAGDREAAEVGFRDASATLREVGYVLWTGQVELERAENLIEMGRGDEATAHLNEAMEIFQRLGAVSWIARANALISSQEGSAAAAGI